MLVINPIDGYKQKYTFGKHLQSLESKTESTF